MERPFNEQMEEIIQAHIQDPAFGVQELAREMGTSHSTLFRRLRSLTGKTINELINEVRLNRAVELIQQGDLSIAEVAARTGFRSQAYFSTSFRAHFGYKPSEKGHTGKKGHTGIRGEGQAGGCGQGLAWKRLVLPEVALVVILGVVLVTLGLTMKPKERTAIAVLPFENGSAETGGPDASDFLWQGVITTLSQIKVFDIRSAATLEPYRNLDRPASQIARKLQVGFLVEGRVITEGENAKLTVNLIDAKTDRQIWTADYAFNISDLHKQMVLLAEHMAYRLNTVLDPAEASAIMLRSSKSRESLVSYLMGEALMADGKVFPGNAIPHFRKAIDLDSTWASPWIGLARCLRYIAQSQPKEEYFQEWLKATHKIYEIRPGPTSYYYLASYYLKSGDIAQARKYCKKGIRDFQERYSTHYWMGQLCEKTGHWKEAESWYIKTAKLVPSWTGFYYCAGMTREMRRDFLKATSYFNQGIAVDPVSQSNHQRLAYVALKWKGDAAEARRIIESAIEQKEWRGSDPNKAYYIYAISDICLGKYEHALEEISKWTLAFPATWPPPWYYHPKELYKAMVYGYLGKPDLERAYYDSARLFIENHIEKLPEMGKRPGVISGLGMAWAGFGDKEKALEMAERTKELLSKNPDAFLGPHAMEDVAWIYMKTGDYAKSLKTLKSLLSKPGPLTAKMLEIDPRWDPLKDQEGYKKLVKKYAIE
jgi:AraC-like DNA-binding protein/tetratricopeptide (TPR) repeat protein